ncbi:TetR/AcrR family transcriptional regulator [Rhodobacter sp. SY28-1]|uniref:TetR/AcrR family transcriptional regulator n=1 Tax=Rhodobacter sp. SY28-1 TaxID=2562317 RepID=UPI0019801264|nr:TetR/AcrR family transcriptional regulator [Rhodobacter sp. SY28-1]
MGSLRKGEATRERLLETAERAVLDKGFSATSIEELIAEVGITKSGFFYHFRDKNELALAMLERYIETDLSELSAFAERAKQLSDDPLQRLLIMLKLYAELLDGVTPERSGCVAASMAYQENQISRQVAARMRDLVLAWRRHFRSMLDDVAERYPPRDAVDLDTVADMCAGVLQGAVVLAKMLKDQRVMGQQVMVLRSYIKLLFQPGLN